MSRDDAIKRMEASEHEGFPVVSNGHLIGLLTKNDLVERLQSSVQEMMTPSPVSIESSDSLARAITVLDEYKIHRLPVTNNQSVIGIITRTDIIRALAKL